MINGEVAHTWDVPADGSVHALGCQVEMERSSWVAMRHFPQLHTNPVNVIIDEQPIRISKESALWCAETIHQLWRSRGHTIRPDEREAARMAFDRALSTYAEIAANSPSTHPTN